MKAMILAAGLGTRLGSLTTDMPKPMLDIAGRPLLEHNIRYLLRHGFDQIMVNLHFMPQKIKEFAGDGSAWGARISYSYEPELLGTAGAVKNVEDFFSEDEPFLVFYGDILADHDLGGLYRYHIEKNASATLVLHQRRGSNSLVRLEEDGRISGFVERPSEELRAKYPYPWVNSGIQILNRSLLGGLRKGEFADLPRDIYCNMASGGKLFGQPLGGNRVAIDSPERYRQACELAARMG